MKRINKFVTILLVLAMVAGANAQIRVRSADGTDLPAVTYCGDTFTVQIAEDGTPVGSGTNVAFVLASIGGDPIYVVTDMDGKAKYKPLVNGILTIRVLDGITVVAETSISVEDEPWVPVPSPTKQASSGGGGGFIIPDPAPVNDTVNATGDVVPKQTTASVSPTESAVIETPVEVKDIHQAPKPKPTPQSSSVPGFGIIFAIVGIFGAVYLLRR